MAIDQSLVDNILNQIKEKTEATAEQGRDSHVLLIDGLNTFLRAFAVNPSMNDDGLHIGGIVGLLNSIGYGIRTVRPTRVVVVFDGKGGSKSRKKLLPEYKEGRSTGSYNRAYDLEDPEKAKHRQILRTVEYLKNLPVTVLQIDGIEADDTIAYASQQVFDEDTKITIMSTDKDFLQLVDDRVQVYSPSKKIMYTPGAVIEDYGFKATNILMYRVLQGDKSDNIPGVHGIGPKRTEKHLSGLINSDERLWVDDLLEYCDKHKDDSRIYEIVLENEDVVRRNWKLMQLYEVDIPLAKKRQIHNLLEKDTPRLNRGDFRELFFEDKLWSAFHSIESWLNDTFGQLDAINS